MHRLQYVLMLLVFSVLSVGCGSKPTPPPANPGPQPGDKDNPPKDKPRDAPKPM